MKRVKCSNCHELIVPKAKVCRSCSREFPNIDPGLRVALIEISRLYELDTSVDKMVWLLDKSKIKRTDKPKQLWTADYVEKLLDTYICTVPLEDKNRPEPSYVFGLLTVLVLLIVAAHELDLMDLPTSLSLSVITNELTDAVDSRPPLRRFARMEKPANVKVSASLYAAGGLLPDSGIGCVREFQRLGNQYLAVTDKLNFVTVAACKKGPSWMPGCDDYRLATEIRAHLVMMHWGMERKYESSNMPYSWYNKYLAIPDASRWFITMHLNLILNDICKVSCTPKCNYFK
jgi:hypothetical protein